MPDTSNTNNSAHNPVFEPEVNSTDENNQNCQSNNESHLYFTLEKSSPSPMNSLPRASTARWEQPDANLASLDHPQSSHCIWQGYETVGELNKGTILLHAMNMLRLVSTSEKRVLLVLVNIYAVVGKHFQSKWPPDLSGRPSIRRKSGKKG